MSVQAISAHRSIALAILGAFIGGLGSFAYFESGSLTFGSLGLPLSFVGFVLGLAALLFRPRAVAAGTVALMVSLPVLAYVAIALALGIRC